MWPDGNTSYNIRAINNGFLLTFYELNRTHEFSFNTVVELLNFLAARLNAGVNNAEEA